MNLPSDTFCILPWLSLEATPAGTMRVCCQADEEITDATGEKFHCSSATFEQVQNSEYMQNLRQQFLDGKKPRACRRCWTEERAGRTSKRMINHIKLSKMPDPGPWTTEAKPLIFLDLKLGNICNLKCRVCNPFSSSQLATEEIQFASQEEKKQTWGYKMLRAGAWPRESPDFWTQLDQHIDQVQWIEFTGGEPFLISEHFDLLERMVQRGVAHNVDIHYNTNGTQMPPRGPDIWRHFKRVEIAVSVDGVDQSFEYQRSNAVWSEVQQNIRQFNEMRDANANIETQVCSTVSIFNVLELPKLAHWIRSQNFTYVHWNLIHDPWYFNIQALPDTAKAEITDYLAAADIPQEYRKEIQGIVDFMNTGASTDGFMTRMKIADLDRKRNQNFADINPQMAQLLDYEFTG